jgi:hypothetical protein
MACPPVKSASLINAFALTVVNALLDSPTVGAPQPSRGISSRQKIEFFI